MWTLFSHFVLFFVFWWLSWSFAMWFGPLHLQHVMLSRGLFGGKRSFVSLSLRTAAAAVELVPITPPFMIGRARANSWSMFRPSTLNDSRKSCFTQSGRPTMNAHAKPPNRTESFRKSASYTNWWLDVSQLPSYKLFVHHEWIRRRRPICFTFNSICLHLLLVAGLLIENKWPFW